MFSLIAIASTASPGPAVLLAINNGMTRGVKSVVMSSLGNIMGLFLLSSAAMIGLGAVLKTSTALFTVLKVIGAAYLIYLGYKKFTQKEAFLDEIAISKKNNKSNWRLFKEGFFIATTNPKAVIFFTALFPLFIDTGSPVLPQFLILTLTFMLYSFAFLVAYGWFSKSIKRYLKTSKRLDWFHKITGGVFISMGLGLLTIRNVSAA